jgi:hypothetical protein
MINKQLKVGDYVFTADGLLARITKINKTTYSLNKNTNTLRYTNIPFNGIIKRNAPYNDEVEWFECDDIQAKAFEAAIKHYTTTRNAEDILDITKELLGKAKYFLNQLKDIEEVLVFEESE